MNNLFSFSRFIEFFYLHIIRHVLAISYRVKLIIITYILFGSKMSLSIIKIFNLGNKVNMIIKLGFYIDSIFDFGYSDFALTSMCMISILCLIIL